MGLVTCFDSTTSGKTMLSVSDPTTTSSARRIVRNEKGPTILRHFVSMFAVKRRGRFPPHPPVRSRSSSVSIDRSTNVSVPSVEAVVEVSWRVRHVDVPSHKSLGRAHRR